MKLKYCNDLQDMLCTSSVNAGRATVDEASTSWRNLHSLKHSVCHAMEEGYSGMAAMRRAGTPESYRGFQPPEDQRIRAVYSRDSYSVRSEDELNGSGSPAASRARGDPAADRCTQKKACLQAIFDNRFDKLLTKILT
jgi:hypothetical protein